MITRARYLCVPCTNPELMDRAVSSPVTSCQCALQKGFCFGDGHVQFIKNSISLPIWQALGSTNGGEVVSSDSY